MSVVEESGADPAPEVAAGETGAEPTADGKGTTRRFRPDIEGLRAVAVLLVVMDHLSVPGFGGGFVGVDIFFVISGFLITSLLLEEAERRGNGRFSIAGFYRRRAFRILPAALTVIGSVLVAGRLVMNEAAFVKLQADAVWATFFGTNIELIRQASDYFQTGLPDSPLRNFWSLAVEEQFYVVWPATLLAAFVLGRAISSRFGLRRIAMVLVGAIGVASFAWSLHLADANPVSGYYSTLSRAWQLALGAGLACVAAKPDFDWRRRKSAVGWLGVGLIAAGVALCDSQAGYPGWQGLLPTGGAALVLAAGIGGSGRRSPGWVLGMQGPRFFGRISYSLYLWHWPIIVLAGVQWGDSVRSWPSRSAMFAASVGIAWLCWRFLETPLRKLGREPIGPGARRHTGLGNGRVLAAAVPVLLAVVGIGLFARPADPSSGALPPLGNEVPVEQWRAEVARAVEDRSPLSEAELAMVRQLAENQAAAEADGSGLPKRPPKTPKGGCRSFSGINDWGQIVACITYGEGVGDLRWPRGVKKLVILTGNSFAGQWMREVRRLLPRDVRFLPLLRTSCQPFEVGDTGTKDSHGNSCDAQRHFVNRTIRRLRPGLVVMAYPLAVQTPHEVPHTKVLVSRWSRVAGRVLFIGPNPVLKPFAVCLMGRGDRRDCNRKISKAEHSMEIRLASAVRRGGGDYVTIARIVCRRLICPAFIGGHPSRLDGFHLSRWMTRDMGFFIRDAIQRAVDRAANPPRSP